MFSSNYANILSKLCAVFFLLKRLDFVKVCDVFKEEELDGFVVDFSSFFVGVENKLPFLNIDREEDSFYDIFL